jgi:hypothetical protein
MDEIECGWDLADWLKRLAANANVSTVLGSIPASSDTVENCGAANEAVFNNVHKKEKKIKIKITVVSLSEPSLGSESQHVATKRGQDSFKAPAGQYFF